MIQHAELIHLSRGLLDAYYRLARSVPGTVTSGGRGRFLDGMCDASHRLGLGLSPNDVYEAVHDVATAFPAPSGSGADVKPPPEVVDALARKLYHIDTEGLT